MYVVYLVGTHNGELAYQISSTIATIHTVDVHAKRSCLWVHELPATGNGSADARASDHEGVLLWVLCVDAHSPDAGSYMRHIAGHICTAESCCTGVFFRHAVDVDVDKVYVMESTLSLL